MNTIPAFFAVILFLTANISNAMDLTTKANAVVIHNNLHKNNDIMIEYIKEYSPAQATIYTKNLHNFEKKTFKQIAPNGNTLPITLCVVNSNENWLTIDVSEKKSLTIKSYQNKHGKFRVGIFDDNNQLIARFTPK